MSVLLHKIVGVPMALIGAYHTFDTIKRSSTRISEGIDSYPSKTEKIAEVVANALFTIGKFILCLQLISVGVFIYSSASTLSLGMAVAQGLDASLPQLLTGVSAIASSEAIRILKGIAFFQYRG